MIQFALGRAKSYTALSITAYLAEALVFCIFIHFGGGRSLGDFFHRGWVVAFEADIEKDVAFFPLSAGDVGALCLLYGPTFDAITGTGQ
jgi:hypothetical protein